ncbi:MAG TPA: amidohydrolase [Candidatus Atribacteria bacterium]|uniref:Amidohydrolase n=1 Tax=candidate division TA06 bacterium 34_109 TaxID=1635277 RepID=A0A101I0B1_UNCT6|nr:MAG: Amidohydrolase [candidate division TA06 bacterium 34_109]HBY57210.1 amidohydrolase [Candidatus Atribacteria bacterium]
MILLKNISYLVRDSQRVEKDIDLLVEGNRIKQVGNISSEIFQDNIKILDCKDKVVIPGLINAHTHLWQSMLKGRRDDLSLVPWCEQVIYPFIQLMREQAKYGETDDLGYLWSMLGAIEMLHAGITSFVDMDSGYFIERVPQAWFDIGIRGLFSLEMVDKWVPDNIRVDPQHERENVLKLIETWHEVPAKEPLIRMAVSASAPFTCSEELLSWILNQANKYNLPVQIHVSETKWEVEECLKSMGMTPLKYLESIDFLSRPIMAVHGVHLTDEEIKIAEKYSVSIIYNPKSNMKLGSGIAPIVKMLREGVNVALASDGAASNDLMDLFEEMRVGVMLQKVAHEDPAVFNAQEIFKIATEGGAKACQINAGIIEEGKLADITVVNLLSPHLFTLGDNDIIPALVYCAKGEDVETVIVNGNIVMENGQIITINEQAIMEEIRRITEKFRSV